MGSENGEWILNGMDWNDPYRVRSWQELIAWIREIGFLPLFRNSVPGFSVEEHTYGPSWWTDDPEQDPWYWRHTIANSGLVAYGKFFGKRAGFISREWFPHFANWRRDGYDFDSRWDEGLAPIRQKKIMDVVQEHGEVFSYALREMAGFGKNGEKNFEGVVTDLQMQGYLVIRDFRQRLNRRGLPYGWSLSVYSTPEALWGYDHIASAYSVDPTESGSRIRRQIMARFPGATEENLGPILG